MPFGVMRGKSFLLAPMSQIHALAGCNDDIFGLGKGRLSVGFRVKMMNFMVRQAGELAQEWRGRFGIGLKIEQNGGLGIQPTDESLFRLRFRILGPPWISLCVRSN